MAKPRPFRFNHQKSIEKTVQCFQKEISVEYNGYKNKLQKNHLNSA